MDRIGKLIETFPELNGIHENIIKAYSILSDSYNNKGKLLIAGNGGSASDAEHIVGELMKGFMKERRYESKSLPEAKLQYGLPAISLVSQSSLITAIANDNGADLIYAQQILGYGTPNDVFLGISTSGNSKNIVNAALVAKEIGLHVISMTGKKNSKLSSISDVTIQVPADETYRVQEYHLPIYHVLCAMLEDKYFS